MRLIGFENPCIYENMSEYLLFEEENAVVIGNEIALLRLYKSILTEKYRCVACSKRYVITVQAIKEIKQSKDFEEAVRVFIREEFCEMISSSDEVEIFYNLIVL